ncbi:MAG: peptidylprolyl isomerase [Desulfovibrionaceae bacterium]|nr:peptidylprolyl isomerase [Desulfovibrionaceae bacterium]MDD4952454.1 peptidylprolyl isomerase [Desulfovibrionaceae bacterium]
MPQAKPGDSVKVHYKGRFEDGTIFDSSLEREPLEFTIGQSMVIPGFEKAVTGMNPGDSKTVSIPAEEAYGQFNEELLIEVDNTQVPPHITPEEGMMLEVRLDNGGVAHVTVREIKEGSLVLDGNHPLAGRDLTFELELIEIF